MDYLNGIEMIGDKSNVRFVLANKGYNPIIVLGLNPSTANDETPDPTMKAVMRLIEYNGYDSFKMINLCPVRTSKPNMLPKEAMRELHEQNLSHIKKILSGIQKPHILLAYGKNVCLRGYLRDYKNDIISIMQKHESKFYVITYNKDGSPKHPLYCGATNFIEVELSDWDNILKK